MIKENPMTDDDVQPIIMAALPGTRYEACWGRKTLKAATFTGRACEWVEGGGMELWHCDHKHPGKTAAQECARQWAEAHAARQQATPPDPAAGLEAMRESIAATIGLPVEFR
jgi:hypothetical protein